MRLDEFESVFRSAFKPTYQLQQPPLRQVALLSDAPPELESLLRSAVTAILADADVPTPPDVQLLRPTADKSLPALLTDLAERPLDLLITHRHVLSHWRDTRHAIGSAIAVLTQTIKAPTLMLPAPNGEAPMPAQPPAKALVATRHLVDDAALVDWALHLTGDDGTVILSHVEDAAIHARYLDAISRIRGIDTELANEQLAGKLLQLSRDYIDSVLEEMRAHGVRETLLADVRLGDPLTEFESLITEHGVDLLIGAANERQSAERQRSKCSPLNGRTFALATEFSHLPVLFV